MLLKSSSIVGVFWGAWGMRDPVATEKVLDAVLALRPAAPLTRLEDLGHYPQIEDPARVNSALQAALAG